MNDLKKCRKEKINNYLFIYLFKDINCLIYKKNIEKKTKKIKVTNELCGGECVSHENPSKSTNMVWNEVF